LFSSLWNIRLPQVVKKREVGDVETVPATQSPSIPRTLFFDVSLSLVDE
jgi:hypothetical protein